MNKPSNDIIEAVAPSRNIEEMPISDGYSIRNVAHAEQHSTMRLPRGDKYESTLVAATKFYDGSSGGEAGHYALIFIEFRATGSRWRTVGAKVRAEEATRIARDLTKGKSSKPGRGEDVRVGGKELATTESSLRGAVVEGGGYVLYVRHRNPAGAWVRTRGVEVLEAERPVMVGFFKRLAEKLKEG